MGAGLYEELIPRSGAEGVSDGNPPCSSEPRGWYGYFVSLAAETARNHSGKARAAGAGRARVPGAGSLIKRSIMPKVNRAAASTAAGSTFSGESSRVW